LENCAAVQAQLVRVIHDGTFGGRLSRISRMARAAADDRDLEARRAGKFRDWIFL